jgi:hypothetical protein
MLLAALVTGLASCARSDRKPVYPVRGKVLFRGAAPAGARVQFHPLDDADPLAPRPGGWVEQDGSFQLSTYLSNDGAPAGRYAVTITWPSPEKQVDGENVGPDRLKGKYGDPKTTPLRAQVEAKPNEIEVFQLN